MEMIVIALFCGCLLCCLLFQASILWALTAGLCLFLFYGRKQNCSWKQLAGMILSGIRTIKNIMLVFVLIGMLTALWRASGTIPVIICYAARLIRPQIFILMAFLLNCMVSVLTGTAFGTAATMGVTCMMMAQAMQVNPVLAGGAVLSGIYFGDRCSPVSTSALLVSELTGTDIFVNIRNMCRTALVPFLLLCIGYAAAGFFTRGAESGTQVEAVFAREFRLHWLALLPAVVIFLLSVLRINVKKAMLASILLAALLCTALQGIDILEIGKLLVFGYHAGDAELAAMLNGGGIASMCKVAAIVCISSSYAGIFKGTGLLEGAKQGIARLSGRITPYGAILCTSVLSAMVACNQTLTIILVDQLCRKLEPEHSRFAVELEDSAVVIAPLIPWSIASAAPLAAIGAPQASLMAAGFLYLLPAWRLGTELISSSQRTAACGSDRIKRV